MRESDEVSFGPWQAIQTLSRGSTSEVHIARHAGDGSIAAVKAFIASAEADDELIRRSREIRLMAEVQHPRVVRILDSRIGARWPERDYIATEYVPGGDLAVLLRRCPLSAQDTRVLGQAIAEALACLHELSIVHRDVKPANIFVPSAEESGPDYSAAKLGDLGIAIEIDATRVTSNGLAVGTANYLSPEQVSGGPITPATDIYSLGLVLLECLSGARAYGGAGLEAAIARLHRMPDIPADAPRVLRRLLRGMLGSAPEDRPSAKDVAASLAAMRWTDERSIAGEASTRRFSRGVAGSHRARGPRRGPRLIAAVGAAAALGAVAMLWSTPTKSPTGAPPDRGAPASVVTQPDPPSASSDSGTPPAQQTPPAQRTPPTAATPTVSDVVASGTDAGADVSAGSASADPATSAPGPAATPTATPTAAPTPGKAGAPGQQKKQSK